MWTNPVQSKAFISGDKDYCFVQIWNGEEWVDFGGPYLTKSDAELAIGQWKQWAKCTNDQAFRVLEFNR